MKRRSIVRRTLAALLVALVLPVAANAAVLPADTTAVISGTPDLLSLLATPVSDADSGRQSVNGNGSRVVFSSESDGLVVGDDDDVENVYVKFLDTGVVELVSRASDGQPAHGDCTDAAISDDGNSVAFTCDGSLDPADTNEARDVYVRNLLTQQTILVSRANGLGGDVADFGAEDPAIDATGRFVAFDSNSDLVASPQGSLHRIYRRDLVTGATVLVSRRVDDNAPSFDGAFDPSISNDGNRVAFFSSGPLFAVDTNNRSDVYVRFVQEGATQLVSRADAAAGGAVGNSASFDGVISGNGLSVAFNSLASNLGSLGEVDLFVRSLSQQTTRLIGVSASGARLNDAARASSVNDDGTVVAFTSSATNADPADGAPGRDAYVIKNGVAQLVSRRDGLGAASDSAGTEAAVSGDGTVVVMSVDRSLTPDAQPDKRSVAVRNLVANTTRTVSRPPGAETFVNEGGDARGGSVSADGRYVAFTSTAPAFGVPFGAPPALFVRDLVTGSVTLVGRENGPDGAPLLANSPTISGDGRRVAFEVLDGRRRIFVRDIPQNRTFIADRPDGSEAAPVPNGDSFVPSISEDGRRVAFTSTTTGLVPEDPDAHLDLFVRDLDANRTFLVNRADGATGAKANGGSGVPMISGDGRSVAFSSQANNLSSGDGDAVGDVYVRNVDEGRTRLVSVAGAATKGDASSDLPSISRDGNRVSFFSNATNFVADPPGQKLYVRDIAAGTLTLAGRADGPDGAVLADEAFDQAISADGNHVAFLADSDTSIAPGAPADGVSRVFERDLVTGTTRLVSRRSGADGAAAENTSPLALGGITADGGCVTFATSGQVLGVPASTDFRQVYMRSVTANCGRPVPDVGPGPGPGPVVKPSLLSRLSVKPARFHVGGRKGGTKVVFRLDKASAVTLRFDRLLAGHMKGKRCLAKVRKGRRCTVVRLAGRVSLTQRRLHAGSNTVKFSGRIGRKALAPGRYRLTATPLRGKARTVRVTVVKAPKTKSTHGKAS